MIALVLPFALLAQVPPRADTARGDTLRPRVLPPINVSVTRVDVPLERLPGAAQSVGAPFISTARPSWGLDEALATVPGVYAANRYNFSLDQRISIRGFGARSSFGLRGIKVLLDGIPQTLPDGSGQLTNLELGSADRIEVFRGPSSALFGNASGGVISIRTDAPQEPALEELKVTAGSFNRNQVPIFGGARDQTWTKFVSRSRLNIGQGTGSLTLSRLSYGGERQHSDADFRTVNAHYTTAPGYGLVLTALLDVGDDPTADNPGALTAAELAKNPDSAAAINLSKRAGKDVSQVQGGLSLRGQLGSSGEINAALFGFARDLMNPQTFAYIRLRRAAYGLRVSVTEPLGIGGLSPRVTFGLDAQRQRDNRLNTGNQAGAPDTVRQLDQLEHVTEVGPFVQGVLLLDARTSLTAGARYDWVSFEAADRLVTPTNPDDSGRRLMHSPSGFLGVTRSLGGRTMAYANVGTSFETPTTTELTNQPTSAGGFNTGLAPQRATNIELGARGVAMAGRLTWSAALFTAAVTGELIAYQVPASPGRVFYQNAGRSRHSGLELGFDAALLPGVRLVTAWTQSDFRYTSYVANGHDLAGRAIPGIPAQWLHFIWRLRPDFARGAWAEIEQTHSGSVLVDDTLDVRAEAWWRTDLRVGWDGSALGMAVAPFAGLNNVFDRHYVGSVVINAAAGRYYEPAPGRNLYVGLSARVGAGRSSGAR